MNKLGTRAIVNPPKEGESIDLAEQQIVKLPVTDSVVVTITSAHELFKVQVYEETTYSRFHFVVLEVNAIARDRINEGTIVMLGTIDKNGRFWTKAHFYAHDDERIMLLRRENTEVLKFEVHFSRDYQIEL